MKSIIDEAVENDQTLSIAPWTVLCDIVMHIKSENLDISIAKSYAKAGLSMNTPKERAYQAAYILNNLRYWRGEMARSVKIELKKYAENKTWQ